MCTKVCVSVLPGDLLHGLQDGAAEGVAADLQNAAGDEEEEEEDPTHPQGEGHPHTPPGRETQTHSVCV